MTTPEGGADPHRDDWVPVPLTLKTYDREARTYVIEFEAPKQLLLNPEYQAMVHDELLRNADRDGLIIEGQVVVTERDKGAESPPDPDKDTREVLLDPSKEEQVAVEQDAIESPYKMSDKEREFRQRMRQNLRDTAEAAFGPFANKEITFGEHTGRVDRDAFMEGFFGGSIAPPPKRDIIVVRAEALVGMDSGLGVEIEQENTLSDTIDTIINQTEIPDDLSGLDG